MSGFRVVIADGHEAPRQISKIVTLGDGGYSVLAPYHKERQGWLAKYPVDYNRVGSFATSVADMTQYSADDRVKLSHHWDGFVQFSGEQPGRIVSGRDPETGEPKGLGLLSAPIRVPVTTGPTFSILVWGLADFKPATQSASDITFSSDDIYYRNCDPNECNAYLVEGWVFGHRMWSAVKGTGNNLGMSVGFRNFDGTGANLDFRALPLDPPSAQFLGLHVARTVADFPTESGFVLNSPSDRSLGSTTGNAMMAMYPRFESLPTEEVSDLNFGPPTP